MAPLAFGSDGGGSIRIPAAHCGIYGIKASMGRVPLYPGTRDERYPGLSSWESLEHVGPLTRTVADAALLLSVVAGPDPRDRHSIPCQDVDWTGPRRRRPRRSRGLRVGLQPRPGAPGRRPRGARDVAARAVGVFADLGAHVEEAGPELGDLRDAFWTMVAPRPTCAACAPMVDGRRPDMSPHLLDLLRRHWTAEDFTDALMTRKRVVNRMWRFMAGYDLLLTPTLAVPPFPARHAGPGRSSTGGWCRTTPGWVSSTR